MTYQLNMPATWNEFKKMPANVQEMYIDKLIKKYGVTGSMLCEMFDVHFTTFYNYIKKQGLNLKFHRGKQMTAQQKENFLEFMGIVRTESLINACEEAEKETENDDSYKTDILYTEIDEKSDKITQEEKRILVEDAGCEESVVCKSGSKDDYKMEVNRLELSFSGKFDKDALFNTLECLIPIGTDVKISVFCEMMH